MEEALIIFTKNPVHGQVKTRLAATIGRDKALDIYKQMLRYTVAITSNLAVIKYLYYSDSITKDDYWSDKIYTKELQHGADLGARMENAFRHLFELEYQRIVIIGTDCPELTPGVISSAFDSLKNNDVVIGPASDGGYYLLGMNKMYAGLFHDIAWSSETVLQDTLTACSGAKLATTILGELSDIDTEEDLIAYGPFNEGLHD
jgi:rSAM/selenodomain-associated transferase 1